MKVGSASLAPIGQAWLRANFAPNTLPPFVDSYTVAAARRIQVHGSRTTHYYPRDYATGDDLLANLRFALRHEPLDLGILVAAFEAMPPETLADWVRAEPTGAYARRAWFLYEHLTGRMLGLAAAEGGRYVPALDPAKHVTGASRTHPGIASSTTCSAPPASARPSAALTASISTSHHTSIRRREPSLSPMTPP